MLKACVISILSVAALSATLQAQTRARDSVMKVAKADARHFRLDKAHLREFRKNRNIYADYFKPDKALVSDTLLLQDSVYVQAFRSAAYERTRHRRTAGHYVWLSSTIFLGAVIAFFTTVIILVAPHMG